MRLNFISIAVAAVLAVPLLPRPAAAQGSGPWFFCYVDPPTFQSGTYVYTRVNYIGNGAIPKGDIGAAMAQANPQVAGREVSCWRYSTQQEAEQRRQQGMTLDRRRNYLVAEISWASPYTPQPAPMETVAPEPLAEPVAATAAEEADSKPRSEALAAPKSSADERYEREMAEYLRQKAEIERQQAEYERALQAHHKHIEDVSVRTEQAKERYDERRAKWLADVEACKAGDYSKCAETPE